MKKLFNLEKINLRKLFLSKIFDKIKKLVSVIGFTLSTLSLKNVRIKLMYIKAEEKLYLVM